MRRVKFASVDLHSPLQTLDVLKQLNVFADVHQVDVPQDAFLSTKLTQKLTQELTDCLVVSARALPEWCSVLVYEYPCLFACDTRYYAK